MTTKTTIKQIFLSNQNWWNFYTKYQHKIRNSITCCIVKLLSCKNTIRGYQQLVCSNPNCSHTKKIPFTCKCKACSSCGKKATEDWITKQNQILPKTSWQHITFTMPSELWLFFWCNRQLLNHIAKLAADSIKTISDKKKLTPGIFIAIHTFGRDLKCNVHIHVSVTTGGLSADLKKWKSLFFHQETLMRIWRYKVITLFRSYEKELIIPPQIKKQYTSLNQLLNFLYNKRWVVYCSPPTNNHKVNVNYLARYTKRPPIAESKLRHYDGNEVVFKYLDHKTKTYKNFTLPVDQFIARFIRHIPDVNFRMIRYYGFLAHRVRGKLLLIVYQLLGQQLDQHKQHSASFAELMQRDFKVNPFTCILCGHELVASSYFFGFTNVMQLLANHRELALLKKI